MSNQNRGNLRNWRSQNGLCSICGSQLFEVGGTGSSEAIFGVVESDEILLKSIKEVVRDEGYPSPHVFKVNPSWKGNGCMSRRIQWKRRGLKDRESDSRQTKRARARLKTYFN